MEIIEGKMPFMGYETYYRIVGKRSEKPPLILLHGGPGSTHNYFEVLDKLAEIDDRRIIMYDQLGCGNSSIPDDHPELYNKETWVKELKALREHLACARSTYWAKAGAGCSPSFTCVITTQKAFKV